MKSCVLSENYGYEEDISKDGRIIATEDEKAQEMQDKILKPRRLQHHAECGDYAEGIAHILRDKIQKLRKRTSGKHFLMIFGINLNIPKDEPYLEK